MSALDWWVVAVYLIAMLALAAWLGRGQDTRREYYLGGGLPAPALATSILATQCSTSSLLGAPAFVGFAAGGGMLWLQYELAVPLAMLALAMLFPLIYRSGVVSVYAFLEQRLGRGARLTASACFLLFRGVATGVTVYGVASVLSLITGLSYLSAVALLMGVTISYDVMGGMRAVVVSDVLQMLLLSCAVLAALTWLVPELLASGAALAERSQPLLNDWGLSGKTDFGLWPMLFGGFFLYMAYYGCDQSQAQRLLAARNEQDLQRVLLLNGLLRFPLVLAYCLLGLGLAAYALTRPEFMQALPLTSAGSPNLNLVFPVFVLREFSPGFAGLAIVGLFAAAMSSIDSALNSLSASTLEDFVAVPPAFSSRQSFLLAKVTTLAWGVFAVLLSFSVERIASTLLEAINKIGSMANGPLLALFLAAALMPLKRPRLAVVAFVGGIAINACLWAFVPQLSWLWWNVTGCLGTLLLYLIGGMPQVLRRPAVDLGAVGSRAVLLCLALGFMAMLSLLLMAQVLTLA